MTLKKMRRRTASGFAKGACGASLGSLFSKLTAVVIRFFFSSRRLEFVRRWWELRWIRVSLRLWREELVNRVCFLVDNYGPEEGVGDNARDILLLPESDWFALHSSDSPDWSFLVVEEFDHGFDDVPEAGEHGYRVPHLVEPVEYSDSGGLGLRDDEPFEWDLGEFATNNPDFTSDDHDDVGIDFTVGQRPPLGA